MTVLPGGPLAVGPVCVCCEEVSETLRLGGAADPVEETEGLVEEKVLSVQPPQCISHTRNAIKLALSRNDSSRKVDKLLDTVEVSGGAVAVDGQAVTDVRDHKGGDDVGEDF